MICNSDTGGRIAAVSPLAGRESIVNAGELLVGRRFWMQWRSFNGEAGQLSRHGRKWLWTRLSGSRNEKGWPGKSS